MEDYAQNIKLEFGVLYIALKIMPSRYLLKDMTRDFLGSLFLKKDTSVLVGSVVYKGCIFYSLKGLPRYDSSDDVVLVFSHVYTSILVGSVVYKGCIFYSLKGLRRYASSGDVVLVFSHVYYAHLN